MQKGLNNNKVCSMECRICRNPLYSAMQATGFCNLHILKFCQCKPNSESSTFVFYSILSGAFLKYLHPKFYFDSKHQDFDSSFLGDRSYKGNISLWPPCVILMYVLFSYNCKIDVPILLSLLQMTPVLSCQLSLQEGDLKYRTLYLRFYGSPVSSNTPIPTAFGYFRKVQTAILHLFSYFL